MGSKRGTGARPSQIAKEYLLANPSATNEQVVSALGGRVSLRTVTTARKHLVEMGLLHRSFYDRRSPREAHLHPRVELPAHPGSNAPSGTPDETLGLEPPTPPERSPDFEKLIASATDPLSVDEMRSRFSAIARKAGATGDYALEINAINALARLDSVTGARDRLGPGAPHTPEERRHRVGLILDAAGPKMAAEAALEVFSDTQIVELIGVLGQERAQNGLSATQNQAGAGREADEIGPPAPSLVTSAESGGGDSGFGAETGGTGGSEARAAHDGGPPGPNGG